MPGGRGSELDPDEPAFAVLVAGWYRYDSVVGGWTLLPAGRLELGLSPDGEVVEVSFITREASAERWFQGDDGTTPGGVSS